MRWTAFAFFLSLSSAAEAQWWSGGYYVENHSACGLNSLPGTKGDTFGFIEKAPSWLQRSFVYQNADVWATDWFAATDLFPDTSLASQQNGADSVFAAYIATHGVTSDGRFQLTTGGTGNGGCSASSDQMRLGDGNLRYMFFSTCQSVKIGDGDNPEVAGESPDRTWIGSDFGANGLRCILGYSSNMVDSEDYGKKFWEKAREGVVLSTAFLDASWDISSGQVPAVICFGNDYNESHANLYATTFSSDWASPNWAEWRWYYRRSAGQRSATPLTSETATLVRARPLADKETLIKGVVRDRSAIPTGRAVSFSDEKAIELAKAALNQEGFRSQNIEFAPDAVRHEAEADGNARGYKSAPRIRSKTVIFRQQIQGVSLLAEENELRISLDAEGRVTRVHNGFMALEKAASLGQRSVLRQKDPQRLIAELKTRLGDPEGILYRIKDSRVGYYFAKGEAGESPLYLEGEVETTEGPYKKLHRVRVAL